MIYSPCSNYFFYIHMQALILARLLGRRINLDSIKVNALFACIITLFQTKISLFYNYDDAQLMYISAVF